MNQSNDELGEMDTEKKGISGWFLLFVVYVFLYMIFLIISTIYNSAFVVFGFGQLQLFDKFTLSYMVVLSILNTILCLLVMVQLIRKNVVAKQAAILFLLFDVYAQIMTIVLVPGTKFAAAFFSVAMALFWIIYLNRSARVANTLTNDSECRWLTSVIAFGGVLSVLGYLGGAAFHIYTAILAFNMFGIVGLIVAFFLPGLSELFLFFKVISESGSFYTPYCMLAAFYLLTTYGMNMVLSYIDDK
jgi:hypothetical protein